MRYTFYFLLVLLSQETLASCTGFSSGAASPCEESEKESTGNSITAKLDRCSLCTDDDDDDGPNCMGCPSEEKLVDDAVLLFFSAHEELQAQVQEMATRQGMNAVFPELLPIRYAKQTVAGTTWFVKVQLDSDVFADVAIFKPLPFRQQSPQIFDIKFNVEKDAPISLIPTFAMGDSVTAMVDRCSLCADGDDDGPCGGCVSDEKPADDAVLKLFSEHAELQAHAQEMASQQGLNADFSKFLPISYATQTVAGRNWFVKVQLDSDIFADVKIFEPLAFRRQVPEIKDIKFSVDRDAPISLIPTHHDATHSLRMDDTVLELFSEHMEFQANAQEMASQQGLNADFSEFLPIGYVSQNVTGFLPIRYATPTVVGQSWFVKVKLGSDMFADVAIFEPIPFLHQASQIFDIKFGVDRNAPISVMPISNQALMV